jgi:cell division protease FtsH
MTIQLWQYAAAHRFLLDAVRRQAGIEDPIAVDLNQFEEPLFKAARRGAFYPLDGVLVRDWNPDNRKVNSGVQCGLRIYEIEGIRFARVLFHYSDWLNDAGQNFVAVDRSDYRRLYRIALGCRRNEEPVAAPPVLPREQLELLWNNTIGYLESERFDRIRAYGGRLKRGVLLTGDPGNGKTMACRWIWEACRRRGWEYKLVTPDSYREARKCGGVKELFTVDRRGIVFFDDMDLALRDRETVNETEDQAVFLSSMDGLTANEGVVFVFTTNCSLELIDRAFRRPGRLDLVLHFHAPDAELRRRLIDRWHADIRAGFDIDVAVCSTDGFSFADLDEIKNLLVMHHADCGAWNWPSALRQFEINRSELSGRSDRRVGFLNGKAGPGNGINPHHETF